MELINGIPLYQMDTEEFSRKSNYRLQLYAKWIYISTFAMIYITNLEFTFQKTILLPLAGFP